ncbi:MAG: type II secretion system protein [Candidatus Spechtbacterales bacterium]
MTQHIVLKSKISKPGFTLIELLVVISIIGLLASIVVVSLGGARSGGRDARAAVDLKQIQTAMELFYDSQTSNTYINAPDVWTDLTDAAAAGLHPYLDPVPATNGSKIYKWCDNASPLNTYRLRVDLENDKLGSLSGDCYYVSNTGTKAGACTAATGCTLP